MRVRLLATTVVSIALRAACGSGPSEESVPTAGVTSESAVPTDAASPTPTPTPTPTAMSIEEAGALYTSIVEPWNAGIRLWQDAYAANDVAAMRALAAGNGTLMRSMTDQLVAAEWPEDVRPTVDRLISEWAAESAAWAQAGASTTDVNRPGFSGGSVPWFPASSTR